MSDEELKICERFKKIRIHLNMKQGDFAKEIKTTQGHVSDIENKRKGVSDRVIEIMCLKFDVNEEWLRNGTGEMFMERDPDEELLGWAGKVLLNETDTFKIRFLKMLSGLSDDDWSLLESKLREIFEERP